ncbi:MAG: lysylphosphatidylglycerol synthase transmembrane domain-containing protein [Pseudomonadota bacterium]
MAGKTESTAFSRDAEEEMEAPSGSRNTRLFLVKLLISALLFSTVLYTTDATTVLQSLSQANSLWLVAALALNFVGSFFTAIRWGVLLREFRADISTRYLFRCWMIACFFNQLLPSTIGGDARRIYDNWRLGIGKAASVAVIVVDRLLGLFALLAFGVFAIYLTSIVFDDNLLIIFIVLCGIIALFLIGAWIFAPSNPVSKLIERMVDKLPSIFGKIFNKFNGALESYRGNYAVLGKGLTYSVLLQLNVIVFYSFIGRSIGIDLTFIDYMLVIPVASVILLLPITINGIGLREGVFAMLLATRGVTGEEGVAFALLSFALFLTFGMIGGLVFLASKHHERE